MIEFSDQTLSESHGSYKLVASIMESEGSDDWMLRSHAIVTIGHACFTYLLHFWHDGKVVIMNTDHPPVLEVPDLDIRELHHWAEQCGWKSLEIHKGLIHDPRGFDFWMRIFRTGLVGSPELAKHEEEEVDRLTKAVQQEQDEGDD